jgi:DNA repair exonuclease SbcCD ATPase subunit
MTIFKKDNALLSKNTGSQGIPQQSLEYKGEIQEREQRLQKLEQELKKQEQRLQEQNLELQERERTLQERKRTLQEREERLQQREQRVQITRSNNFWMPPKNLNLMEGCTKLEAIDQKSASVR